MPGASPALAGVVEDDDVDIARIIELMRPELAHGDDEIALGRSRRLATGPTICPASRAWRNRKATACSTAASARDAHRLEGLFRRPDAAKIGETHKQSDPPLEPAQGRHGLFRCLRRSGRGSERRAGRLEMLVRIAQQAFGEEAWVALGQSGEIGRAGERRRKQRPHLGLRTQKLGGGGKILGSRPTSSPDCRANRRLAPRHRSAGLSAMRSKNAVTPA